MKTTVKAYFDLVKDAPNSFPSWRLIESSSDMACRRETL